MFKMKLKKIKEEKIRPKNDLTPNVNVPCQERESEGWNNSTMSTNLATNFKEGREAEGAGRIQVQYKQ